MENVTKSFDQLCPVRDVISDIGDKWTMLVMFELGRRESMRFSELRRAIPDVSQRMLTQTLRKLQRNGFVDRTVTHTVPPHVDYALNDLGKSLVDHLLVLNTWALAKREAIHNARTEYDLADR